MKITWFGHSAVMIEDKYKILIDPFIEGNPATNVNKDDLKPDLILVTHGHGDHLGNAIEIAKKNDVPVIAIYELAEYLSSKGVNSIGMNFSGTFDFNGIKITMVYALHTAGISEDNFQHSGGLPCGYIINGSKSLYHAGDTGLFGDMELIGKIYHPEISMLPIGGFFTMGIKEAVYASKLLKSKYIIPIHYNTFDVIKQDPEDLKRDLKGIADVIIFKPGETKEL
ncbi:MAG: metal-dependent hydrolase [Thermoplasmata archaeon]|nr:metal-dependent hydrolase [Thermoplasmata archaeon]